MRGMMIGYHGSVTGGQFGLFSAISIIGLFAGVMMIVGAIMIRTRIQDHFIWGVLILIFALVSFVDMGGYFVGAILGIVGAALALSYSPQTQVKTPQNQPPS